MAATIGSLFAAALSVVSADIVPALRSRPAHDDADEKPRPGPLLGALVLGGLVLVAFILADVRNTHTRDIDGLLGALLGFGSAQIALVPLVLMPLLAGSTRFGRAAPGRIPASICSTTLTRASPFLLPRTH